MYIHHQIGEAPTSRSKQRWEVPGTAIWSPSWKVPGSASIPRVRLQSTAQRSPAFNANPQADNHQLTYKYAALAIIRNALLSSPKSQSFC